MYRHTYKFLFVPIVVAILLSAGLVFVDEEFDPEKLYTPDDAPSFDEQDRVEASFGFPIVVQAGEGCPSGTGTAGVCKSLNGDGLCLPFADTDAEECSSGAQPRPARPAPPVLCPNLLLDLAAMVWGETERGDTW